MIRAHLYLGDTVVEITGRDSQECLVRIAGPLDSNEVSAVHFLAELLRCLKNGKSIDHHFNPATEDKTLIKCEWLPSGKLAVREEGVRKRYQHAETVTEAMERNRTFTCTRSLLHRLPGRREVVDNPGISTGNSNSDAQPEESAS